ncbi:MarR family transcriptional regulator [Pseudaeromonas paramecii]|uniref:Multidrug efflux transporter EmrAB transcriptional repressor EmrR n=1 Tax=Pseudaeromonas paramecii TaxID=2138166 RepID=A0ABP8QHK2_9GAMM
MTPCKLPIEKMIARVDALLPGTPTEELLLGRLLMAAQHRLTETKARGLAEEGVSESVYLGLMILLTYEEGIQPSELSRLLEASRTSGTRLADELVARGWASRQELPEDRRCQLLRITQAGQDFLLDVVPRQRARLRAMWQAFDTQERSDLTRLLRKILETLPE